MGDDIQRQLEEMVHAVWRIDTRRGYRCKCCGVTFIDKYTYFRHTHPSAGRR